MSTFTNGSTLIDPKKCPGEMRTPSALSRLVLATSLAAIAALTLAPSPGTDTASWLTCLFCGELATADAIRNVLLFIPLGIGLALCGVPLRTAVLLAVLFSGAIELTQLYIPGRDASVGDLLSNSLGAAAGLVVVHTSGWWMFPTPRRSWGTDRWPAPY
jgi:hypothetical protein